MDIEIRQCKDDELPRFVEVIGTAFGEGIPVAELDRFRDVLETERMFAGFDAGTMVGTAATFSFDMTVPGGTIPTAGVTMVGVLPTHRRRGIMSGLMRAMLDDAQARREPAALLWASEESIYQRFGYGLASNQGRIDIERHKTRFLGNPPPVGETRLVSLEGALEAFPPIYDRVRALRPGALARSQTWWRSHTLADPERARSGQSEKFYCVYSHEGEDRGYAMYRTGGDWDDDATPQGWLNVREVAAVDPIAYREVWRYLFSIDLIQRIKAWYLPADFPLPLMLESPRHLRFSQGETLWLRLVDVAAALEERTYAEDGRICFAITDAYCPWNEGEWTLEVTNGRGRVQRGGEPKLSLDVSGLAAVYLGGFTFAELQRALRLEECTPEAVAKADRMFHTDIAPWCAENF